jgi:hypothetical protein
MCSKKAEIGQNNNAQLGDEALNQTCNMLIVSFNLNRNRIATLNYHILNEYLQEGSSHNDFKTNGIYNIGVIHA